jgi:dimethylhistidine N-methyltransferase
MTVSTRQKILHGNFPSAAPSFEAEVRAGLRRPQKTLPCKFFYDEQGSKLFDRICELPEYYLTRTELRIMRDHVHEMARRLGPRCEVIEYGSGSGIKTRLLLAALDHPVVYVPIDISGEHMSAAAAQLEKQFPRLEVLPVCADYTRPFELPEPSEEARRRVVYFPGSTIGNFEPPEARAFLRRAAELVGPSGGLLIGIDRKKDPARLHAAYNDAQGVTAAFNRNVLMRMAGELECDIEPQRFHHYAFYEPRAGRIEMHLVSDGSQTVRVGDETFYFADGESIHTECSYKYSDEDVEGLARDAGLRVAESWSDADGLFGLYYFEVIGPLKPMRPKDR